jgi:preprotein translocase subunit SecF
MSSLAHRLYNAEAGIDFVGRRKTFYLIAVVMIGISVLSMGIKGFNYGIEFQGGTSFRVQQQAGVSLDEFRDAIAANGATIVSAQTVRGVRAGDSSYLVRTESLSQEKSDALKKAVQANLNLPKIDDNQVSSSWGSSVTRQALYGLIAFLIAVMAYLAFRYEWRMSVGAMLALIHDLVITAGIYSLVGLEVTPSTVIGLLTILGFSLYDTVVVFDKVAENTRGILGGSRYTYSEAANLAVNQTLMRSINTSVIALLPVAGLLFIGAGLLGAGTLKDLGLVLFVGMAAGTYSSIFLATPIVADLHEREPRYKSLRTRVLAKRNAESAAARAPKTPVLTKSGAGSSALAEADSDGVRSTGGVPSGRPPARKKQASRPGRPSGAKRKR